MARYLIYIIIYKTNGHLKPVIFMRKLEQTGANIICLSDHINEI